MSVVDITDLEFRWKGQSENLFKIPTLKISRAEKVFLKGASGSGKSTLLSLLAGIHIPQKGKIEVLEQPISALKPSKRDEFRANHIGYIFQMFNLVPYLSLIDNICLPCHFSAIRNQRVRSTGLNPEQEARRLLEELKMQDEAFTKKPVSELSIGQQQRVAACRALIGSPEILIADEPTSSLDEETQIAFIKLLIKECAQYNITLIFVSHDNKLASYFDRKLELKGGQIQSQSSAGGGGVQ